MADSSAIGNQSYERLLGYGLQRKLGELVGLRRARHDPRSVRIHHGVYGAPHAFGEPDLREHADHLLQLRRKLEGVSATGEELGDRFHQAPEKRELGVVQHRGIERDCRVTRKLGIGHVRVATGERLPAFDEVGGLDSGSKERPSDELLPHHATGDDRGEQITETGVLGHQRFPRVGHLGHRPLVVFPAGNLVTVLELERNGVRHRMDGVPTAWIDQCHRYPQALEPVGCSQGERGVTHGQLPRLKTRLFGGGHVVRGAKYSLPSECDTVH